MPQKKTKVIREIPENPFIQGQAKRKKLRVAAYCRVSTEQEEQESSLKSGCLLHRSYSEQSGMGICRNFCGSWNQRH